MKFAASLGANRVFPSSPDEVIAGYGDVKTAGIMPNPNKTWSTCEDSDLSRSVNGSMQRTKMNSLKSLKAYTSVDRHSGAEGDDTHAMIAALFDELLRRMQNFSQNIVGDDEVMQARNESYAKSLAILHALQSCLDFDNGGEIAENLFRLYEFARQQLLASLRTGEVERVNAAIDSLSEIRDAWNSMDRAEA